MQIQALHTAHKLGWIPAYDWWADHQQDHPSGFSHCARWMESAPVLPATVLGMELLLQDRSLQLQMAADIILKDVGATLQIMRLVADEFPEAADRPVRMADCLAALDVATWFSALSANVVSSGKAPAEVNALWKHCRSVASYARLIAESLGEISGEDAYLAGLLHEVENLSVLLGIRGTLTGGDGPKLGEILSPSIVNALQASRQRGSASIWRYVLASAHALATTTDSPNLNRAKASSKPFVV